MTVPASEAVEAVTELNDWALALVADDCWTGACVASKSGTNPPDCECLDVPCAMGDLDAFTGEAQVDDWGVTWAAERLRSDYAVLAGNDAGQLVGAECGQGFEHRAWFGAETTCASLC
jgi:hypothetical protein